MKKQTIIIIAMVLLIGFVVAEETLTIKNVVFSNSTKTTLNDFGIKEFTVSESIFSSNGTCKYYIDTGQLKYFLENVLIDGEKDCITEKMQLIKDSTINKFIDRLAYEISVRDIKGDYIINITK